MWNCSPGLDACSSVFCLGVFVIFAMAHALHLKSGCSCPIDGIPFVHFAVSCNFFNPICPICWCHISVANIDVFGPCVVRFLSMQGVHCLDVHSVHGCAEDSVVWFCVGPSFFWVGGSGRLDAVGVVLFLSPVLPNPCVPCCVESSVVTGFNGVSLIFLTMSCAILPPFSI